jgi:hypothetical protein
MCVAVTDTEIANAYDATPEYKGAVAGLEQMDLETGPVQLGSHNSLIEKLGLVGAEQRRYIHNSSASAHFKLSTAWLKFAALLLLFMILYQSTRTALTVYFRPTDVDHLDRTVYPGFAYLDQVGGNIGSLILLWAFCFREGVGASDRHHNRVLHVMLFIVAVVNVCAISSDMFNATFFAEILFDVSDTLILIAIEVIFLRLLGRQC